MGPLDLFYSWQACVIAVLASGTVQVLKRSTDILRGLKVDADGDGKVDMWEAIGRELRRDALFWNKLVLPSAVVLAGAFWAAVLPVRPEYLFEYAEAHAPGWRATAVFAGWGAACGQLASSIFTHVKEYKTGAERRRSNEG